MKKKNPPQFVKPEEKKLDLPSPSELAIIASGFIAGRHEPNNAPMLALTRLQQFENMER